MIKLNEAMLLKTLIFLGHLQLAYNLQQCHTSFVVVSDLHEIKEA